MSSQPLPHPDHDQPPDDEPETISTPEGDNENPPDAPLSPRPDAALRPRGDAPHSKEPPYPAI
ncbi:hypothetical protein [Granulicella paludicola]|uniref:hypothetical protein n=1 Tax=Granulicella paludicola TaxID=474951 RepID=UPI0021DFB07C|nr:hypothetical protein [Granulicella paludicola]